MESVVIVLFVIVLVLLVKAVDIRNLPDQPKGNKSQQRKDAKTRLEFERLFYQLPDRCKISERSNFKWNDYETELDIDKRMIISQVNLFTFISINDRTHCPPNYVQKEDIVVEGVNRQGRLFSYHITAIKNGKY